VVCGGGGEVPAVVSRWWWEGVWVVDIREFGWWVLREKRGGLFGGGEENGEGSEKQ
jgi:hypothetical protein